MVLVLEMGLVVLGMVLGMVLGKGLVMGLVMGLAMGLVMDLGWQQWPQLGKRQTERYHTYSLDWQWFPWP